VTLRPVGVASKSSSWRNATPIVWRSHLVARQWLRLASRRRLGLAMRLFLAVIVVDYVAGYGMLAADPWWRIGQSTPTRHQAYIAPTSDVLRFFVFSTAYILIGL